MGQRRLERVKGRRSVEVTRSMEEEEEETESVEAAINNLTI